MKIEFSQSFIDVLTSKKGHALGDEKTKRKLLNDAYGILILPDDCLTGRRHNFPNGYEIYEGPGSSRIIAYRTSDRHCIVDADKHDDAYEKAMYIAAEPPVAALSADLADLAQRKGHWKHDDACLNALLSYGVLDPILLAFLDDLDSETREQMFRKEKIEGSLEVAHKKELAEREKNRLLSESRKRASLLKKEDALARAMAELKRQEAEEAEARKLAEEAAKAEPAVVAPEPAAPVETKPVAPAIEEKPAPKTPVQPKKPKEDIDPEALEKAILDMLADNYRKQVERYKKVAKAPLRHVKLAEKEEVVEYRSVEELWKKIDGRMRRNGLRMGSSGWLILLATTVPEEIADLLDEHYPGKVYYTDEPGKGKLDVAIIVKKAKAEEETDDLGVRRMKSKQKEFGAKKVVINFHDEEEEDDDYLPMLGGFFFDDEEPDFEEPAEVYFEPEPVVKEETKALPKKWHCYVCGKKKLYTGTPDRVTEVNGKTVYLCKKHKDAI